MIWSKECIKFSNDDLAEVNRWAELHAKDGCEIMKLILADKVPVIYISKVSDKIVVSRGIYCPCGQTYFCGELEPQDLWAEEDLFDTLPPVRDKNSDSLPPIPWESVEPLPPIED